MAGTTFARTLRSLDRDNGRLARLVVGTVALLVVVWSLWLVVARVRVRERSVSAHVQIEGAPYLIHSPVAGNVVKTNLVLGRSVEKGDILLELDATTQRIELEEMERRCSGIAEESSMLRATLDDLASLGGADESPPSAALAGTAVKLREAQKRMRVERELRLRESEQLALTAKIAGLQYQVALRTLRAPAAGTFGDLSPLHPGEHLVEGARLGAIISRGLPVVVAQFSATTALGRVHPGQPARTRFTAFPWTQFGSVYGTVSRVASDTASHDVRVEFDIDTRDVAGFPITHGLEAIVDVDVETISPAQVLLRAIGRQ